MHIQPGWCRSDVGLDYGQALTTILCFSALSGAWLRLANGFQGPGFKRMLAVLPVVAGNLVATKLFCRREDCVTLILAVFNMWLQSFKVRSEEQFVCYVQDVLPGSALLQQSRCSLT